MLTLEFDGDLVAVTFDGVGCGQGHLDCARVITDAEQLQRLGADDAVERQAVDRLEVDDRRQGLQPENTIDGTDEITLSHQRFL